MKDKGTDWKWEITLNLVPFLLLPLYRLWCSTLRITYMNRKVEEEFKDGGVVGTFWHNRLFPTVHLYAGLRPIIMVSRSKDGEFISRVIEKVGMGTVRGSSSRGGREALAEMIRMAQSRSIIQRIFSAGNRIIGFATNTPNTDKTPATVPDNLNA